jgi:serine/threonine-protein kinase
VELRDTDVDSGSREGCAPTDEGVTRPSGRPERIRLFGVLGRGGMGVVLRGHDTDLGRDLAVKVLQEQFRDEPEMVRRFVEEAQIGGQLQHPGVVPVYELGSLEDRRPYIAMRLVDGRTLAAMLAVRAAPDDDRARLLGIFESVCQTMAYAHARGVIHRDLKPSNIMVGSFGEVQVMDWGLAKVLASESPGRGRAGSPPHERIVATTHPARDGDRSRPGSVLGTPAYMSPEQARGEVDTLDERADVFALGSILCEILTGAPAFAGGDWSEIERRAARGDVAETIARLGACGADPELTALAGDCLASDASGRPRDARAVAQRVTAYRAGVQERLRSSELARVEAQARAIGERRRRRLAVALAASIVALLLCGGGAGAWMIQQRQSWLLRVAVAMKEAELLRDQAAADPGGDLGGWQAASAAARRLVDLREGGHAPAVRDRIDDLAAQIERGASAAHRDRRLIDRLEDVREEMVSDDKADPEFASAFTAAGYDVLDPSVAAGAIGRDLARRPRSVALAAAAALDTWAVVRRYIAMARPGEADPASARRLLAVAREADPDPWRNTLRDALGDGDPASLLRLADDPELDRRGPVGLWLLGHGLEITGSHDRALELLRRAQRRYPNDYWLNTELGLASLGGVRSGLGASSVWVSNLGAVDSRFQRAEPYFMAAVAVRPQSGYAHLLLAQAMLGQGKWDESFAGFREALRLRPDDATIHNSLGVAYQSRGDPRRAADEYREAIRLWPAYALARGNLGDMLMGQGRLEEAAETYREAIRQTPEFVLAHGRLGQVLTNLGRLEEAAAAYRETVRRAPRYAAAHAGLGGVLRQLGDFDGASAALRTAFELQSDPQWQAMLRRELDRTARWAALAPRLAGVLRGSDRPGDAAEVVEFAYLAHARLDFVAAAQLFGRAFRLEPRLAEDWNEAHLYNAACCAAMAACGRGRGESRLAAPEIVEARQASLGWLRADLAARSRLPREAEAAEKGQLLQVLGHWKVDPELAGLRDAEALAGLPEPERRGWLALWGEVDALIGSLKAGAETTRPAADPGFPAAVRGFLDPAG